MIKRIRVGVLLMLIGIAIPLVLMFFQEDGELFRMNITKSYRLRDAEVSLIDSISYFKELLQTLHQNFENLPSAVKNTRNYSDKIFMEKMIKYFEEWNSFRATLIKARINQGEEGPAYYSTTNISIGIPYRYTIGFGVLLFIIGIGIIIISLIGRKGKTS